MNNTLKKTSRRLHLWLGFVSGIIVFIVCVTGALYVFKDEIEAATEPWRFVRPEARAPLTPERLIAIAGRAAGEKAGENAHENAGENPVPSAITYGEAFDAAKVDYLSGSGDSRAVWLNPYNGKVIKVEEHATGLSDFFDFVLRGHLSLWLPRDIGSPIVSYAALAFLVVLLSGMIVWWPRRWSRKALKGRLAFHRPLKATLLSLDLHNVVGFYALLPLIVLCLTGMLFGLPWFSRGVYALMSGGETMQAYAMPSSDTLHADTTRTASLDRLYRQVRRESPDATGLYFTIPQTPADIYRVSVVHKRHSYYRTDNLYYDRYTLRPLSGSGPWAGRYNEVKAADRLMRMNLEIHDGRILGPVGKIIMFLAAVTGASLPVTGFLLWRKRKWHK